MTGIVTVPRHRTLDDVDVYDKTVLVRCDLNVPVDKQTKEIRETFKIEAHKETLQELVERGAKVVVISHQSRPGKPDCISLKQHAAVLSRMLGKDVKFVDDIFGDKAKAAIKGMKSGDAILLENLRMHDEENQTGSPSEMSKTKMVQELSKLADIYICDAFACTHRPQPSMVGFPHIMPSVVARLMEKELKAVMQVNVEPRPPMGYVLGGAKLEDSFLMVENALKKGITDYIIVTGVPSLAFLKAKGYELGAANDAFLAKNGYEKAHEEAARLMKGFEDKIYLPVDLAVEKGGKRVELDVDELPAEFPIKDIGSKTIEEFSRIIDSLNTVFCNGPAGVFEDERFAEGTKAVFKAMADSDAYSVIGGGDTSAAIRNLGISGFNHVSSGGGALLHILAGRESEALKEIMSRKIPMPPRGVK